MNFYMDLVHMYGAKKYDFFIVPNGFNLIDFPQGHCEMAEFVFWECIPFKSQNHVYNYLCEIIINNEELF